MLFVSTFQHLRWASLYLSNPIRVIFIDNINNRPVQHVIRTIKQVDYRQTFISAFNRFDIHSLIVDCIVEAYLFNNMIKR